MSGYRALTAREREILDFLLAVEGVGMHELRRQAEVAVARPWACGCASVDLVVDRDLAPRSPIAARPAVEAASRERRDALGTFDLLVWVEDGWLTGLEIVEYGFERHEDSPDEFPPPDDFGPPGFGDARR